MKYIFIIIVFSSLYSCQEYANIDQRIDSTSTDDELLQESKSLVEKKWPCVENYEKVDSVEKSDSVLVYVTCKKVCLEDYAIEDTEEGAINKYSNYKYLISILNKDEKIELEFTKELLRDSLTGDYLKYNVLGNYSFKEITNEGYIFQGFIGYPYSDDGWMFDFGINKNGKISILRTYDVDEEFYD